MVSFLDNEGLRYYDERLKVWVEAKVEESSSVSDEKIKELDEKVKTKVANSLDMSLDETTYVLTVKLLSESGEELSKATVDLPVEELVKDGRYDDTTKEIVLILESGTEIRVPVGDLVENKVDKLDTKNVVYATDGSTPPKTIGIQYMESPLEGTIPIRDGIGSLQVPTAQDATQAVNKGQMDTVLDGKVDKTTASNQIYGTGSNGVPTLYTQTSGNATRFTLPLRNEKGAIVAANPTQNNELTTKEYVDNLVQAPTENGVFTHSVTIGDPDANSSGGTNTKITDRTIDMWSRAGGEELTIILNDDPNVYYRNHGQSKNGSAKFEDIVNVANAYGGASFYLTPFTVGNLKAGTVEVQDELILKSPNGKIVAQQTTRVTRLSGTNNSGNTNDFLDLSEYDSSGSYVGSVSTWGQEYTNEQLREMFQTAKVDFIPAPYNDWEFVSLTENTDNLVGQYRRAGNTNEVANLTYYLSNASSENANKFKSDYAYLTFNFYSTDVELSERKIWDIVNPDLAVSASSTNAVSGKAVFNALANKADQSAFGNFIFDTDTLKNDNDSAEVVLGNTGTFGMPDQITISQKGINRIDVAHNDAGSWSILDGNVQAFSSDANPVMKEASLFKIIDSSEKTDVISDTYGAVIKSDKLGLVNTFMGEAATLTITNLEVLSNGETKSETLENIIDAPSKMELISADIDDTTNAYYPNKEDKEVFNTARNTISGSESVVGSKGFAINENNFHYGCLGLFVFKPYVAGTTLLNVRTITCERFGQSQDFTVAGKISDHEGSEIHLTLLTEEAPYLYSEDTYSFSKVIFKNAKGEIIETLEPSAGQPADLIQWYGCVSQWTKTPSTAIADYVELQGDYYMPKADNIGAFYYVDIPSDVITQNLVDEPTCIKIDSYYDSGTRQSYIDWSGHDDECLKANYTMGDSFLTLSLKKNKRDGQGLEQKPVFGAYSCIRFPDHPEIGNIVVGNGHNNVFGDTLRALFDYGFSSGKNNASLGKYSTTCGTRNTAVYGGVALGNHNAVLGQSGFAVGETNFVSRSGRYGAALGSNNTVNGKNGVAAGRSNEIDDLYGVAFGYGNTVKGKSSSALGYTNSLNDDGEFAAGTGNTLSGENAVAIGRANQSYGKLNTCIGYGNIVNKCICGTAIGNVNHVYANYAFAAGNNNTVDADASGVIGLNLNAKVSSESGVYNNVGHLLVGSNNTINGGRNLIMGGQSSVALLHDSIVIGNNLKETSKGFGKAIFGSYNAESGASIVLGAGNSNSNRKNVFEVFNDGAVKTPNARRYTTDGSDNKRLTTKEYVDDAIATAVVLVSPNGTKYKITVDNTGTLSTTEIS